MITVFCFFFSFDPQLPSPSSCLSFIYITSDINCFLLNKSCCQHCQAVYFTSTTPIYFSRCHFVTKLGLPYKISHFLRASDGSPPTSAYIHIHTRIAALYTQLCKCAAEILCADISLTAPWQLARLCATSSQS